MCRFGRLFMFKSNCEGSHFHRLSFLTPATCRVGQLGKPWYSAPRLPSAPRVQSLHLRPMHCQTACSYIAAAASTRPSACSRSLRPCPHRCCHCFGVRAGCSLWLCTRPTARTALQVCVWRRPSNGPCASRTAQLHARMRQRRMLPELPRDGRRSSVRASAGWEGVGGRWPACAIPKPAIWADQCLGHRGFHPSQATRARARGEGACCCAACQHNISARPAAPCAGRWPRLLLLPYLRWAAASR